MTYLRVQLLTINRVLVNLIFKSTQRLTNGHQNTQNVPSSRTLNQPHNDLVRFARSCIILLGGILVN